MKRNAVFICLLLFTISSYAQSDQKIDELEGVYIGNWASNKYNVDGTIVMTIKINNGIPKITAVFTGSEYFTEDELIATFKPIGAGIWQMIYKGKKSKIKGSGLFKSGGFIGDYKFKKYLWTDTGKWTLKLEE